MDNSELRQVRLEKLDRLEKMGINPFGFKYDSDDLSFFAEKYSELSKEELTELALKGHFAGRITNKRSAGKTYFADVDTGTEKIQIYVRRDSVGDKKFEVFEFLDLGDIIGFYGTFMKTNKGEFSIQISDFDLLSKSLRPLPDKYHGLENVETKYRKRYLDLISNSSSKKRFVNRSKIISEIRRFLEKKGFLEVETPVFHEVSSGASARPFVTHHNSLGANYNLRIALELHLKRLIVGGFNKVFEIGKVFRNEGIDTTHNPEFTMLELYQAYTDYIGMMEITEELFRNLSYNILGTSIVVFGDHNIELSKEWRRIHMVDAVKEVTGIDFWNVWDSKEAIEIAKKYDVFIEENSTVGTVINAFFENFVEETLIQPTFIYGHPIEISPLASRNKSDGRFTDRFELFIGGKEFANAYSELNDPLDQRNRFEEQMKLKISGDLEAQELDEDFIEALEYGMPPTGGLGIGVDRLVMLLTETSSIRDVILFPTLKRKGDSHEK